MMTNCVWQGVQGQLQFEEPRTLPLLQDIRPTHTTGIFDQNSSDAFMSVVKLQLVQVKPFPCPECEKPSRDKITMIRHFAFTHGKLFELTEVTPAHLISGGTFPVFLFVHLYIILQNQEERQEKKEKRSRMKEERVGM